MATPLRPHTAPAVFELSRFEQRTESRYKCHRLARVFPIGTTKDVAASRVHIHRIRPSSVRRAE
jgi:hypothetical protein